MHGNPDQAQQDSPGRAFSFFLSFFCETQDWLPEVGQEWAKEAQRDQGLRPKSTCRQGGPSCQESRWEEAGPKGSLHQDLGAPRRSRELQPAGGRGWNTEGTGLSPAPGPAVRLVKGAVPSPEALSGGGGRWLLGHQPCWSLLPARRRGRPSQSTYPLNVYRLAVRAGLPTAHVVVVVFIYIYIYTFF